MRRLALVVVLLLAGCVPGEPTGADGGPLTLGGPRYHHDAEHGVSCWTYREAISCLPDSTVRNAR